MGRVSTKKDKTIYQIYREDAGLTREKASELMKGISTSRIEKIEYETQEPAPYDVVEMADCYKRRIFAITIVPIAVKSVPDMYRKWRFRAF